MEMQAKLHGKDFRKPPEALDVSKEDRKEFDKDAQNLLKKMNRRHLKEKIKNNG